MELRNKKILLVGLGILGGGLSMARFLLSKGARLTITDLRDKKALAEMVKRLPSNVKYTLGKHKEDDFRNADIVIFNPAVSILSPWSKLAQKLDKPYFNDYTFFLETIKDKNPNADIIGITGTRGKTTTSLWANYLIDGSILGGNIPEKGLLKILGKKTDVYVLELSSFQLEYSKVNTPAPHIAIITNIYNDHLNRYGKFDVYAKMKFNIFKNQTKDDYLILNADEAITKAILKEKPKSQIYYTSGMKLPVTKNGLYFVKDTIFFQDRKKTEKVTKVFGLSRHEKANLLCAILAARLAGTQWKEMTKKILALPQAPLRQEIILKSKNLTVVNDSAGTSPDAVIAAIEKYGQNQDFALITGGTDKELDFTGLAKKIVDSIPPKDIYLLEGSATERLKKELKKYRYPKDLNEFDTLEKIVKTISKDYPTGTILFSPGGASFEKFKNEFDRGNQFNRLVRKYFIEKKGRIG
jgi:UDP-N-acetylmuramoylalanine--D-glutamate ligase